MEQWQRRLLEAVSFSADGMCTIVLALLACALSLSIISGVHFQNCTLKRSHVVVKFVEFRWLPARLSKPCTILFLSFGANLVTMYSAADRSGMARRVWAHYFSAQFVDLVCIVCMKLVFKRPRPSHHIPDGDQHHSKYLKSVGNLNQLWQELARNIHQCDTEFTC